MYVTRWWSFPTAGVSNPTVAGYTYLSQSVCTPAVVHLLQICSVRMHTNALRVRAGVQMTVRIRIGSAVSQADAAEASSAAIADARERHAAIKIEKRALAAGAVQCQNSVDYIRACAPDPFCYGATGRSKLEIVPLQLATHACLRPGFLCTRTSCKVCFMRLLRCMLQDFLHSV